eukprot:c11890_g1_i1.p1 GENE.c11890_g1_i1~~c11890_g1_i1.p1  ORF type:complete len:743 (-),score=203.59 c11890_g1_i1:48-2276(-)
MWNTAAQLLKPDIEELVDVLEERVLPYNYFTRRRGDFRGSQLHLQGLIKAVISDFSYKKIFSSRTAGGKRNHSVVVVLDESDSMEGTLMESSFICVLMLVEALRKVDIESFSLIVFGETVKLIKSPALDWSPAVVASLLSRVQSSRQCRSNDAAAIQTALTLLEHGSGTKKVFVFSDGFSSNGLALAKVLMTAEEYNVDVIGVGVGLDKTNVGSAFPKNVKAAFPSGLAAALRQMFDSEDAADRSVDPEFGEAEYLKGLCKQSGDADSDVQQILAERWDVFAEAQKSLSIERTAKLVQGDRPRALTVDLAFILDCTGSMTPILQTIKAQIHAIIDGDTSIGGRLKKEQGIDITVNVALLGFRDNCDSPRFIEPMFPEGRFTSDIEKVKAALNDFKAQGGGDLCEDVPSAVTRAMEWDWNGNIHCALLVTDSPCHGKRFHTNNVPDDAPDSSDNSTDEWRKALTMALEKDVAIIHAMCNPDASEMMHDQMMRILIETHGALMRADPTKRLREPARVLSHVDVIQRQGDGAPNQAAPGTHVIFILDESGSMGGTPWNELVNAYRRYISRRMSDQGETDIVSIVQFSSSARITLCCQPMSKAPNTLDFDSGGTSFLPAIQKARECIRSCTYKNKSPQLVFMTDGEASDTDAARSVLVQLYSEYKAVGMKIHAIGIGSESSTLPTMQELASAAGSDGKAYALSRVEELTQTFVEIAGGSSPTERLYQKIGEEISNKVQTKLMLEYL